MKLLFHSVLEVRVIKTEREVSVEIIRLQRCIQKRIEWIKSTDYESRNIYRQEIIEIENDIKRLEWVLEV